MNSEQQVIRVPTKGFHRAGAPPPNAPTGPIYDSAKFPRTMCDDCDALLSSGIPLHEVLFRLMDCWSCGAEFAFSGWP